MKIQMKHFISGCALFVTVLTACSDDDFEGKTSIKSGDAVQFAASSRTSTRTVYDDENIFQINWEEQDKIKIYSNKTYEGVADADYTVTPIETEDPKKSTNKLYNEGTIAAFGTSQLMWADNDTHKFIGVYPSDNSNISVDAETGIVTLPIKRNQRCEVVAVSGNDYYSQRYSDYTYYAKPDMKNAYLVAYNALTPEQAATNDGNVFLDFKPVMTTIEVVVKGRAKVNEEDVQVTGISVVREVPEGDGDTFTWNAETGETTNKLPESSKGMNTQSTTTFVGLKTSDDTNIVTLKNNESIVFTVFLPPYAIDGNWPMKIRVHATGATEIITKDISGILASNKRRVTLPNFKSSNEQIGNNWITPLDDNIYVSQLSIPGTHDAATGDGTTFSLGKTQDMTLDQQFEMGIRAFDLRPALNASSTMILCHGIVATTFVWDNVMERFKYYLKENPGEFIIAIMRHEDEYSGTSITHWTNENTHEKWAPAMLEKLNVMKNTINPSTNQSYTIDFRPDLTVGEMRGKILFMCRSWTKYNDAGPVVGGYHDWSHSKDGGEVSIWGPSSVIGTLNIQDCYNRSEAGVSSDEFSTVKWNAIEALLEKSRYFHTNPAMINRWSYNHTSGYTSGIIATASITDGYRENAANNHIKFYNKITSTDWVGSTGIILSDFVGARRSGNFTVYGDLLPQAIINNNYKYRMKRKGE